MKKTTKVKNITSTVTDASTKEITFNLNRTVYVIMTIFLVIWNGLVSLFLLAGIVFFKVHEEMFYIVPSIMLLFGTTFLLKGIYKLTITKKLILFFDKILYKKRGLGIICSTREIVFTNYDGYDMREIISGGAKYLILVIHNLKGKDIIIGDKTNPLSKEEANFLVKELEEHYSNTY